MTLLRLLEGEALAVLRTLPTASVHAIVTSPPYWKLRDYDHPEQLGLEDDVRAFVARLVGIFEECRRVLHPDGVVWLNLGDTYAGEGGGGQGKNGQRVTRATPRFPRKISPGLKPKDLVGVPWRAALALQDAGWWLRAEVIWHKPNPIPESVTRRPSRAHEHLFLLANGHDHYFDGAPLREPARTRRPNGAKARKHGEAARLNDHIGTAFPWAPNEAGDRSGRSIWTIPVVPSDKKHPAPWPPRLARRCVLSACPPGGVVLDPFCGGSGAAAIAAVESGRHFIGIDLRGDFLEMTRAKVEARCPLLILEAS